MNFIFKDQTDFNDNQFDNVEWSTIILNTNTYREAHGFNEKSKGGDFYFYSNKNTDKYVMWLHSMMKADELYKAGKKAYSLVSSHRQTKGNIKIDFTGTELMNTEFLRGYMDASYSFDKYKSKKEDKLTTYVVNQYADDFEPFLAVQAGVKLTKDLVNEAPNKLYPQTLANIAKRVLRPLNVKVDILGEKKLKKLGMGSLLAVGQGSAKESKVIVMHWKPKGVCTDPIALVGKGVTFDTGGYNLKPSAYITDMKSDMGGAAAVIGTMRAVAKLGINYEVIGVVGAVENMISSTAMRPDDVIQAMNGTTIEVTNTDAEGRMVLADILHWTNKEFQPRVMIDLATLTGAVSAALGDRFASMFTHNASLKKQLMEASSNSHDKLWELPFDKIGGDWDKAINSKVADIVNSSRGLPGSTEGAQFLQRFVGDARWAHLDIAGVTLAGKGKGKGWATGYGVKLLTQFIADFDADEVLLKEVF